MKRLIGMTLVALAAVSGCGGEATISTDDAVAALREAGFRNLMVHSNEEALKRVARELGNQDLARDPLDVDTILPRGRFESFVTMPIGAVRHPSVESAEKAYASDRAFLEREIPPDARELLPANFDPSRLREERVCNVIVSSYNAEHEAELASRFERATELLRAACG